jgi:hypothetical protein
MDLYRKNLNALEAHYPELAERLLRLPDTQNIKAAKAQDGGLAYCIVRDGKIMPITNPVDPLARIQRQVDDLNAHLQNYTRPIFIVGLNPGNEVISLYNISENCTTPHCPQPLWLCIDSCLALYGFLNTWDVTHIIASPRVRIFWHEDAPIQTQWLRQHPEFPHVFTLISGSSDQTLNTIMPHFAKLISERDQQTETLKQLNNRYYDRFTDQTLHAIFSGNGPRKPRLLMPTCTWSTFIQHSTRDTCNEFRALGWDVLELKADAMLTPYFLVHTINQFKPDLLLFIDHMRYEAEEIYPRNMLFVTWIQDEMDHIFCNAAGESMARYARETRRDLVVGYITNELTSLYSYPEERLVPLPIKADPHIFRPVSLTDQQTRQYACELAFMTNASMSTEQIAEEKIIPQASDWGISPTTVHQIHDHLWTLYRAGQTRCHRQTFLNELCRFDEFAAARQLVEEKGEEERMLRLFYWKLNDAIYRHVVIEWADQLGVDLHLYGHGWQQHPRFSKYAHGTLQHGEQLNAAYQAARFNLHLNITQGMHQRVYEIISAGARPLFRAPETPPAPIPPVPVMREWVRWFSLPLGSREDFPLNKNDHATTDWIFRLTLSISRQAPDTGSQQLQKRLLEKVESIVTAHPSVMVDPFERLAFATREQLQQRLKDPFPPDMVTCIS